MKKVFTFLAAVLLTATVWAQSPEKMSYQAVIRNSSEALVTNTTVGMQISILQGSATGTAVYVETQTPTTNAYGLVSIEIGAGTVVSGTFASIDWANGPYFIKTETDPTGGTTYTITGTSQLLSVPYALHAKTAETVTGGITETDPIFTSSQAANITATDITNLSNLSGVNTGDQDLSALATKAYVDALLARIEALEESDLLHNGFTDSRDGTHYNAVKIGNQIWMKENLKYLPSVVGPGTGSLTTPYYYVYDYNGTDINEAKQTENYNTYGVLYNWPAAINGCPDGWHLPTDEEWTELVDYLGGYWVAGGKLKETGTTHWDSPNTGATNETGFTALGGGRRSASYNSFINLRLIGRWWSATEFEGNKAGFWIMYNTETQVGNSYYDKNLGHSVRCVKD